MRFWWIENVHFVGEDEKMGAPRRMWYRSDKAQFGVIPGAPVFVAFDSLYRIADVVSRARRHLSGSQMSWVVLAGWLWWDTVSSRCITSRWCLL